jgi:hypothetical protein
LHDAGVEVTILNTVFDSADRCVVNFIPKDRLTLYNSDETHYLYFSPVKPLTRQYPKLDPEYYYLVHEFTPDEEAFTEYIRQFMEDNREMVAAFFITSIYKPDHPHYKPTPYDRLDIKNFKSLLYYLYEFKLKTINPEITGDDDFNVNPPEFAEDNLLARLMLEFDMFVEVCNEYYTITVIDPEQYAQNMRKRSKGYSLVVTPPDSAKVEELNKNINRFNRFYLRYLDEKLGIITPNSVIEEATATAESASSAPPTSKAARIRARMAARKDVNTTPSSYTASSSSSGTLAGGKNPHKTRRYKRYLRRSRKATPRK